MNEAIWDAPADTGSDEGGEADAAVNDYETPWSLGIDRHEGDRRQNGDRRHGNHHETGGPRAIRRHGRVARR